MEIKNTICGVIGIIGAFVSNAFGGWSAGLTTLCIFMGLDYFTGLIVAGVFQNSEKTKNGGLESRAGWKGLIRKGVTLAIVYVGYRLDLLIGQNYIKDAVIIAFCVNELISLIENAGLMGIPIPDAISKAIEVLKGRTGDNDDQSTDDQ